jgi:hypothetical protein
MNIRHILEIENPRPVKESHTCFVSFVPANGGGYHAAYREFTPYSGTRLHNDMYSCSVRYQKYDANFHLVGDSHLLRTLLQDPRCFVWKERPYALVLDDTAQGHSVYSNFVIDLTTGECRELMRPMVYAGKNWMPVPDGDRLFFIRSVEPTCIVECNERWECTPLIGPPSGNESHIGTYRGGAAANKVVDGIIWGVGHRTIHADLHVPYFFKMKMADGSVSLDDLTMDGFSEALIDPTSIIDRGIVLTCSNKAWHHQDVRISTRLCELT